MIWLFYWIILMLYKEFNLCTLLVYVLILLVIWKGCQMQGGRRSHSGAMVTDDNEADGAIPGEAGETSPRPWVLITNLSISSFYNPCTV